MAQTNIEPKPRKWGIGIQLNTIENDDQYNKTLFSENVHYAYSMYKWENKSYSFGITGTYILNENIFFRLNSGIVKIKYSQHIDTRTNPTGVPPPGYTIGNMEFTQTRYYFSPRIGWEIRKNKFGLYGGFSLPLTLSKQYKNAGTDIHYDDNNIIDYSYDYQIISPGGFSIGLGAFGGFNFYILKQLSIGAEVSSSYSYFDQGGTRTETVENQFPSSPNTISTSLFKVNGFDYSGERLSFNINYLF